MYLSFNSKVMNGSQISDYLNRVVQPKLQTIDGVANAEILGGQIFAMRIWLDPDRMAALGVTPLDVRAALANNNFTSAPGQVKGDFVQTNIDAKTSLDNPEAFGRLVVLNRGDALIRLTDIAEIELGPQSADSSSVFDGLKAVFIGVYATPTANPLTVITNVRKAVPEIQRELPVGLEATIAYDATNFIRASLWEVVKTLSEAALIVVVVIFLFLGNLRSTIIPIVTIPLSLIGVLGLLLALGYSINLMTLLALVLAIGLVVDDAIVVVENIYRHIEEGKKPMEAALLGAREIVYPIIAMTITLAAVFAPIGFVSGLTGALFKEFAFTLAGAVVVSGVVALTLSPMMCSRLLKAHNGGGGGRFTAFLDRMFDGLKRPLSAQAARHPQLPSGDAARARWRHRRDRPHVYDLAEGARAGRGPGHPVHPGEDAAIRQSRLSRGRDPAALQGLLDGAREGARVHHQRHGRRASGLRRHPAQALGRADADPKGSADGARAAHLEHRHGAGHCLLAAGTSRLGRRTRRSSSSSPRRATPASSPTCLPMSRSRRARAACSSSRIPIFASRRRRSSFISTTTRRTGSASRWPISAARSRRCSAATTSICSTSTGEVIA